MARLFVGTSGFAYKTWKPEFYPADLKQADMLAYYAARFSSVEINNTFYRMPRADLLERWNEQVPDGFVFTLKAPQRITHIARLRDVAEPLDAFVAAARVLGERLGCVLFQCPPTLRRDDDLLDGFLQALAPHRIRAALEFRHDSWREQTVLDRLSEAGVAWCTAEDTQDETLRQTVESFVYLRLRRVNYDDVRLREWAERARSLLEVGTDVYAYFKHEDEPFGVRFAMRFRDLVG